MSDTATPTISDPRRPAPAGRLDPCRRAPGRRRHPHPRLRGVAFGGRRRPPHERARVSCCTPAAARSPSSPRFPTSGRCRRVTRPPSCASRVGPASERCTSPSGAATYADAELITDPRPTPRVEALGRELRGVLGVVAELRRSRRLPELLRTRHPSRRACRRRGDVGRVRRRPARPPCSAPSTSASVSSSFSTGRATTSPSCRSPSRSATT